MDDSRPYGKEYFWVSRDYKDMYKILCEVLIILLWNMVDIKVQIVI